MIDVKIMHNILITVNAFFAMATRFAVCACVNQADNNHKNGWHAAAGGPDFAGGFEGKASMQLMCVRYPC